MSFFLVVFEAYRVALRVLAALMGFHFVGTTLGFLRHRPAPEPKQPETLPHVTVQLPMRNEYYAGCRVLEAVAAFDYPLDRLEIQVLDDSDDGTSHLLAEAIARLRASGRRIEHLCREVPHAYKAGALDAGLKRANGELIAMFDADFVPPPDFLQRLVPHFGDPEVGMVQGRWLHLNREQNWLTRLQAQILDGLFVVEQTAKSRAGVPFQFNGTAGIWRRAAIDRAGGWTFDSLTEDLDLSIRAQLAGFKLVHLPDVTVASELPTTLATFRVQQRRWALGTAQLLRKRLRQVLTAPIPLRSRIAIVSQLSRHLVHPLVLALVVTAPITTLYWTDTPLNFGLINAVILGFLAGAIALQHAVAARVVGTSALRAALRAPVIVALAIGLAPTYTVALYYGLRDRAGVFFRTPKVLRPPRAGEPEYRPFRSWLVVVETAVGLAYAYFTVAAFERGLWLNGSFLLLVCVAYIVLGLGSLRTRPHVQPEPAPRADVDAASVVVRGA